MNQIQSAALTLAGIALAFLAVVFAIWWFRRPRAAPAAPRVPGESRLPKLSRKDRAELEHVEISPSRLARISRKAPLETQDETEFDPAPVVASEPMATEALLESMVSDVEEEAHRIENAVAEAVSLRLVPQIPKRDAISTNSWLGGRPRLSASMEWPKIDDQPADFLAQISCADLPRDLWD